MARSLLESTGRSVLESAEEFGGIEPSPLCYSLSAVQHVVFPIPFRRGIHEIAARAARVRLKQIDQLDRIRHPPLFPTLGVEAVFGLRGHTHRR